MRKRNFTILFCLFLFAFVSKEKNLSWNKISKKEFSIVSSGNVVLGSDTLSVQSFFISKNEITNKQYHIFLNDLKTTNRLKEFEKFYPDTLAWVNSFKNSYLKAYSDYYFCHPAYENYPVVNISYESAQIYCDWYTEKINKDLDGKDKLIFRLPTKEEFVRACEGDNHENVYSWNGPYIRNQKGNIMCNHMHLQSNISENLSSDNADIIAPVKSYWPNQFGIYNLNGNVAELISEKGKAIGGSWRNSANDVTNESILVYENSLPTVGFRIVATKIMHK